MFNKDKKLYEKLAEKYKEYKENVHNTKNADYIDFDVRSLTIESAEIALEGIAEAFNVYNENAPVITKNNVYRLKIPVQLKPFFVPVIAGTNPLIDDLDIRHTSIPKYRFVKTDWFKTAFEHVQALEASNVHRKLIAKASKRATVRIAEKLSYRSKELFNDGTFVHTLASEYFDNTDSLNLIADCLGAFEKVSPLRGAMYKQVINLGVEEKFALKYKEPLLHFAKKHNAILTYIKD